MLNSFFVHHFALSISPIRSVLSLSRYSSAPAAAASRSAAPRSAEQPILVHHEQPCLLLLSPARCCPPSLHFRLCILLLSQFSGALGAITTGPLLAVDGECQPLILLLPLTLSLSSISAAASGVLLSQFHQHLRIKKIKRELASLRRCCTSAPSHLLCFSICHNAAPVLFAPDACTIAFIISSFCLRRKHGGFSAVAGIHSRRFSGPLGATPP